MRNIKLTLEYEGTNYAGWQVQPDGVETVQGVLSRTLTEFLDEDIKVTGASRTDAGVHALSQVAAFTSVTKIPLIGMQRVINTLLPPDIVITGIEEVALDFDPRRNARSKSYLYRILNRPSPSALNRRFAWHVHSPLDIEPMLRGAQLLIGRMDFASFMAHDSDAAHSIREVTSLDVRKAGDFVEIEVKGTAFLRHMVRIMVGTLVAIGKGRLSPDDLSSIIAARDRTAAPMTAPPHGLFLKEVVC
ncbi:MAG: tRNA pseudouridine(38-40) synthase TruA [Thermodesulfobacteriota bacterium]